MRKGPLCKQKFYQVREIKRFAYKFYTVGEIKGERDLLHLALGGLATFERKKKNISHNSETVSKEQKL